MSSSTHGLSITNSGASWGKERAECHPEAVLKLPKPADDSARMGDANRYSLGRLLVERGVISDEQLDAALAVQRTEGRMLGEILTARGWVTPLSIAAAVVKQRVDDEEDAPPSAAGRSPRRTNWKPLGTLLLEKSLISEVQLKQALALQRDTGGFLGEILVQEGWISAADLVLALAAQLGLELDVNQAVEHGGAPSFLPSERPAAYFEVVEQVGGEARVLKTAETFMAATDYVFDEVLWKRDAGDLEIVRVDGGRRESAWSHRPGDAASYERENMLGVFGYHVGQWQDKHADLSEPAAGASD